MVEAFLELSKAKVAHGLHYSVIFSMICLIIASAFPAYSASNMFLS